MAAQVSAAVNGLEHDEHIRDLPTNPLDLDEDGEEGDLFGDEDEGEESKDDLNRKLDDSELDSGDDVGRTDRVAATVEEEEEEELEAQRAEIKLLNADIVRIKPPEGDELYLLNMPDFLGLKHKSFDPASYEPPSKPHGSNDSDSAAEVGSKFSPFDAATSSIYWRRDPKDLSLLQSNARIIRWSDGSLTLQHANNPKDQYRITLQPLRQTFNVKKSAHIEYDPTKDSHIYLAAPHDEPGVDLQIMAPLDAAMKIHPSESQVDESLAALQATLSAQAQQQHDPLANLKQVKEDPELARKAAEMFEKDRMRTARKREAAEDRLMARRTRILGRSGLGTGAGAGLSVAGLEGDEMPTARGRKNKMAAARRKSNRHGDIYSDDEDDTMPRGRTREDEYDREDDFLADSDEEPEVYDDGEEEEPDADAEDDPDVDDLEIEGRKTVLEERTRGDQRGTGDRGATPKRSTRDDESGDAEGATGAPQVRKKRRVIDEDEEE